MCFWCACWCEEEHSWGRCWFCKRKAGNSCMAVALFFTTTNWKRIQQRHISFFMCDKFKNNNDNVVMKKREVIKSNNNNKWFKKTATTTTLLSFYLGSAFHLLRRAAPLRPQHVTACPVPIAVIYSAWQQHTHSFI